MASRHSVAEFSNGQDLAARLEEFRNLPILYEDDPEWDMGEADLHAVLEHILRYGLEAHFADRLEYRVFSNLNLYYQPKFPSVYVSPDIMIAKPKAVRPKVFKSYRIGSSGPSPEFVGEVLSEETGGQDLDTKAYIYAMIGVSEYLLVDSDGAFLAQRLVLKRLQPDRTWKDQQDRDGGITSRLGFRVIWDADGLLRVVDAKTGQRHPRPSDAHLLNKRVRELEAELARLKDRPTHTRGKKKP